MGRVCVILLSVIGTAMSGEFHVVAGDLPADVLPIRAGVRDRVKTQNPVWIKYTLRFAESRAWQEFRRYPVLVPGELKWECDAEYAQKGVKFRSWVVKRGHPVMEDQLPRFVIYNGELQVSCVGRPNDYIVTSAPRLSMVAESPFELCGDGGWAAIFDGWERDPKAVRTYSLTTGDMAEATTRLEVKYPNGWGDRAEFRADIGYAPVKTEGWNQKGIIFRRIETTYEDVRGVFYPKRCRRMHYMGDGALGYTVDYEATFVESDASKIPDSLFTFAIPEDGAVYDRDRNVALRNSDLAESSIAGAIERLERPKSRRGYWIGGALLVLLLSAVIVIRRRRARAQ